MTAPTSRKRSHRLWIPIGILLLAAGACLFLALQPELERNLRSWAIGALVIVTTLLLFLWFLLLGRFHWKTRLVGLALVALLWLGGKTLIRRDGTASGTGLPRFTWVWTGKDDTQAWKGSAPRESNIPAPATDALDVPQFFGPKRDGHAPTIALDPDWQAHPPKELWRHPVGQGWSAFAVSGGRAFTMEQRGDQETTVCYDVATGVTVWTHANKTRFEQWQAGAGPHATPAVHDSRLYTYGGTGILNCLDTQTGNLLWSENLLTTHEIPNLEWGISCSPLIVDDLVVVTGGDKAGPTLTAHDRLTGDLRWTAGKDKASYAAPLVATLAGKRTLLSNNRKTLTAHDPATGEVLLDYAWMPSQWPRASQPVVVGDDQIVISAGYGLGCSLLKITAQGEKLQAEEVWHNLKLKTQFNSVALRDDHVYGLDDGKFACLRVSDGERLWKEGRFGSGQSILSGDFALIQSERGDLVLARVTPGAYEELGRIPALSAKTWTHPVLAGPYLLLRNDQEAVCYRLPTR